ncbi:TIGR03564 family F420-dependent LLM class oxidoreductase [Amycolatopsis pithecellobii]|uniref:TIGR03564 family F420-dependent LLM class oxidoreductase n=1 Tax=Amycolatopsis pithecellobii TaxID=664692 RepID=A0A6N7YLV2_9PSEU|nr:TIGR03564 family F420-dependent LLM class oxidoreductase [Amycolatopsis pithecellobii]MTD53915.1 TIGR03564 family F420-dependent LLM class oxidoreductase [Amycolatopsis pithecellobii]
MRIGIQLPTATPEQFQADVAAAKGADSLWTNQLPGGWDALLALGTVGGTQELGTSVIPTYPRHPAVLADQALTLQALSGGRFTLGIGPSHPQVITGQYGLPYTAPARHTREYLEVLRPLLRGEHVKHSGEFFTVDTALTIQADPPPVLIAALGPRMLEVARDLADGTIAVWIRPDTVSDYLVPRLHEGARVAAGVMVAVTNDPDGVREQFARETEPIGTLSAYRAILDRGGISSPADTLIAGSEEVVLREIQRFADAGLTDLVVAPLGDRPRVVDLVTSTARMLEP